MIGSTPKYTPEELRGEIISANNLQELQEVINFFTNCVVATEIRKNEKVDYSLNLEHNQKVNEITKIYTDIHTKAEELIKNNKEVSSSEELIVSLIKNNAELKKFYDNRDDVLKYAIQNRYKIVEEFINKKKNLIQQNIYKKTN
jgi:hypothetical protein